MVSSFQAAYDRAAASYDREVVSNPVLAGMRELMLRHALRNFRPGDMILELNCGTGEDALFFAKRGIRVMATDISAGMIEILKAKARVAGLSEKIEARVLAIENLGCLADRRFDGAFSNLGGLNCVRDLSPVSRDLSRLLKPGAVFACSVRNKTGLAEILAGLRRWDWRGAFGGRGVREIEVPVAGTPLKLFCRPPGAFARSFKPDFQPQRLYGMGIFAHLHSLRGLRQRHATLLPRLEDLCRERFPFSHVGDYFGLELRKIV